MSTRRSFGRSIWQAMLLSLPVVVPIVVILSCIGGSRFLVWAISSDEPEVYHEFRAETTDHALIEGNAEIRLPPSTHDLHGLVDGFRDVSTFVRFSINADELAQFLSNTLCSHPLETTEPAREGNSTNMPDWWTPDQAQHLQKCSGSTEDFYQEILVDTGNASTYTVYVVATTH